MAGWRRGNEEQPATRVQVFFCSDENVLELERGVLHNYNIVNMLNELCTLKLLRSWGTWMAQSVKRPALAQVMISRSVSSSPESGSLLTDQSPEPASDSVSPSVSAPPPLMLCLSPSLKNE